MKLLNCIYLKWLILILIILMVCANCKRPLTNQSIFKKEKTLNREQFIRKIAFLISNLRKSDEKNKFSQKQSSNLFLTIQKTMEKRGERRCGQKLIQHLQRVCNNCIRNPDTEATLLKDKRTSHNTPFMMKRGQFLFIYTRLR